LVDVLSGGKLTNRRNIKGATSGLGLTQFIANDELRAQYREKNQLMMEE